MPATASAASAEILPTGLSFELIKVEGGTFLMGSDEYGREQPIHEVKVPDFYLGKHLVTQALWQAVMGDNPSRFKGADHPVERVSWDDVQLFLKKLNALTGKIYRLPSEAEWEYAARGGRYSHNLPYAGSNKLKEVGWYGLNSHGRTKPVGLKLPNELGLYDMSGNVWEWCADHWHENYEGAPADGSAWLSGGNRSARVLRGGAWGNLVARFCRAADRVGDDAFSRSFIVGFRVVQD